jgi:thioredoxin reductase (NADPH)
MQDFDLVIVGAGVAGLTAAMFGGRYGLKVGIVDQMGPGGQIINAEKIENFPGFPEGLAGYDLGPLIQEQAENAGAEFMMDKVESLETVDGVHVVNCADDSLRAPTVIIAAGSALRPLGVPGEEKLTGKGVSHCATCDGPFFNGQPVCVIGGGDSALDEALVLTEYASHVTVFHRGDNLDAQQALIDKVAASASIEVALRSQVEEIVGDDRVTGVRIRDRASDSARVQALNGVFVYVGLEPNTAFLRDVLKLDATGHIETDIMMQTSLPGVFAAGDIRKSSVAQLVAAAGDGATAAIAAYRYLRARE